MRDEREVRSRGPLFGLSWLESTCGATSKLEAVERQTESHLRSMKVAPRTSRHELPCSVPSQRLRDT